MLVKSKLVISYSTLNFLGLFLFKLTLKLLYGICLSAKAKSFAVTAVPSDQKVLFVAPMCL